MPLIVDKEKEKKKILDAFEKCLEENWFTWFSITQ